MIRILFAHPDQKLTDIYTRQIENYFWVDSAIDGLSAIRKFRSFKPSLVISDYHLPLLSGISLLGFVRAHPDYHATPFIFLTDHPDNSEALNLGANEWIDIKHSHPEFLLSRIDYHLRANKHALQIH